MKVNCSGKAVTEDACQQSPDNVATVIACDLCCDNSVIIYLHADTPASTEHSASLVIQIWSCDTAACDSSIWSVC